MRVMKILSISSLAFSITSYKDWSYSYSNFVADAYTFQALTISQIICILEKKSEMEDRMPSSRENLHSLFGIFYFKKVFQ